MAADLDLHKEFTKMFDTLDKESAVAVLKNEAECVRRQSGVGCNRKCESCDLVLSDSEVLAAYDAAIRALNQYGSQEENPAKSVKAPALPPKEQFAWNGEVFQTNGKYITEQQLGHIMNGFKELTYVCSVCGKIIFPLVKVFPSGVDIAQEKTGVPVSLGNRRNMDNVCKDCARYLAFKDKVK